MTSRVYDLVEDCYLDEEEWLRRRRLHLTASDAPAILGVSWKPGDERSRDELWEELAASKKARSTPQTLAQRLGHELQSYLLDHATEAYGLDPTTDVDQDELWIVSSDGLWAATYDRMFPDVCCIDAKTVGLLKRGPWNEKYCEQWEDGLDPRKVTAESWMDIWTTFNVFTGGAEPFVDVWGQDQPPQAEWCKMQCQLLVRPDLKFAVLSALLGHKGKIHTYKVERDPRAQELLIANGREFKERYMK